MCWRVKHLTVRWNLYYTTIGASFKRRFAVDFDIDVPEEVKAHASRDVLVALQRRMQLTKNIVATFVKVAGSGGHWRNQGTASQCQRTMSEVSHYETAHDPDIYADALVYNA